MKRVVICLLAMSLLLAQALCPAAAEEVFTAVGFEYALLPDGSAELIRYTGPEGSVIIPAELDGHPVMAVRKNPFLVYDEDGFPERAMACTVMVDRDHPYLATIDGVLFGKSDRKLIAYPAGREGTAYEIPEGILTVGDYAFGKCGSLKSVTIPGSVTAIGNWSFAWCGLTDVTIPDSVTAVGEAAFFECDGLTAVTIPDSVTSLGPVLFYGCGGLTSVTLPRRITEVRDYTFRGCGSLTAVAIPEGVTAVGRGAFYGCGSLTDVTIPGTVTSIDVGAFCECRSLTAVTIPAGVADIGEYAFSTLADGQYYPLPGLTLAVTPGSYAHTYCLENGLAWTAAEGDYSDAPTDWLDP